MRMILRRLIVLGFTAFLFLPAAGAKTNKLFIDFSLFSKHMDSEENYNEINPGAGLSYFIEEKWELRSGYYNNSYERPTLYFTANYIPFSADLKNFDFNFGVAAGLATGYKDGELLIFGKNPILFCGTVPVLSPNVSVLFKPAGVRFVFIVLGNALALQTSYMI